jgi:hypothetical protein
MVRARKMCYRAEPRRLRARRAEAPRPRAMSDCSGAAARSICVSDCSAIALPTSRTSRSQFPEQCPCGTTSPSRQGPHLRHSSPQLHGVTWLYGDGLEIPARGCSRHATTYHRPTVLEGIAGWSPTEERGLDVWLERPHGWAHKVRWGRAVARWWNSIIRIGRFAVCRTIERVVGRLFIFPSLINNGFDSQPLRKFMKTTCTGRQLTWTDMRCGSQFMWWSAYLLQWLDLQVFVFFVFI